MNKIIITLIITTFLVGAFFGAVVTAAIVSNDRTERIDSTLYDKAVEVGLDVYGKYDERQGGLYNRCLFVNEEKIGLLCSGLMEESRLDNWEKETVWGTDGLLQGLIDEDNIEEIVRVAE